jgi:predicted N-acyltransferase
MADDGERIEARLLGRIADIPAAEWDSCAGRDNPFLTHDFLSALEESGSVGGRSGWLPRHLVIEDGGGRLRAAAPLYLKAHSYGEYVFDHGWAEAYERAGGEYYPKLQLAVPFTPVPGPRLLLRPGEDEARDRDILAATLVAAAEQLKVSSLHATFLPPPDASALAEAGFLLRHGYQFHWQNRGYRSFDEFLGDLSSRKRKAIKRERREVAEAGITLRPLTGRDIEEKHWDAFFHHYQAISTRKWGTPYLTRSFFSLLGERMADRVLLVLVEKNTPIVAGALNLIGSERLYGRNWGATEEIPFAHFEACYYQAIDFAIARGLKVVEAGAQGEHKVQRGYLPVETISAHWIADRSLRAAVANFLKRETAALRSEIAMLAAESPFKKDGCGSDTE